MVSLGFCPNWFFQYSIMFEIAFAIITLFVALYSFRVYKLSKEKNTMLFGVAFLFLSISYFVQSALNIGILYELSKNIDILSKVSEVINLGLNALYTHIVFTIIALTILVFITLKTKSLRIFLILLFISILPIYLGKDPLYSFYVISSTYLIFINYHYLKRYIEKRHIHNLIVFIAFMLLFLSDLHFIFSINHQIFYVLGHYFELATYILLLINLIWVLKK